jgi:hypothetical protein
MSSYIPLYILLFKTTEDNINVETMLVNKIKELKTENEELKTKLASFNKTYGNDTDDEKLSLKKPLSDDEGDNEVNNEGNNEDKNEGNNEDKKNTNKLSDFFSEELNIKNL